MHSSGSILILFCGLFPIVSSNCRNIWCYMKTNSSLTSPNVLGWEYSTCAFMLQCSRAHGRVPSRCRNGDKKLEACSQKCGDSNDCQETLYLTGKADCKGNTYDPNAWMVPEKTCCLKHEIYTEGKTEILPEELNDKYEYAPCSDCVLEKIKQTCNSECGHDKNYSTYNLWALDSPKAYRDESCTICVEKAYRSYCSCTPCVYCYFSIFGHWDRSCGGQSLTRDGAEAKLNCLSGSVPNYCQECVCWVICIMRPNSYECQRCQ